MHSVQNRRQKVVSRGLYVWAGGIYIRAGGLDNQVCQKFHYLQRFIFQFRGLGALFGGQSPPKSPRGDGTVPMATKMV